MTTATAETTQRKSGRPATGRPRAVTLTAFVEQEMKDKLGEIAIEQRRSVSSLVDVVLSQYIAEWEKSNK